MFCPKCGRWAGSGSQICQGCGAQLSAHAASLPPPNQTAPPFIPDRYAHQNLRKDPGIAALLALVLGFFGIMGVGHLYIGKMAKGVVILLLGAALAVMAALSAIPLIIGGFLAGGVEGLFGGIAIVIMLFVGVFAFNIWQVFDAYNLAKRYNDALATTGTPPW